MFHARLYAHILHIIDVHVHACSARCTNTFVCVYINMINIITKMHTHACTCAHVHTHTLQCFCIWWWFFTIHVNLWQSVITEIGRTHAHKVTCSRYMQSHCTLQGGLTLHYSRPRARLQISCTLLGAQIIVILPSRKVVDGSPTLPDGARSCKVRVRCKALP
jgi:hypothetical protein